ncbi:DUF3293 domain-containing protein [Catenovulum adriaticum]|uniref:DUF3293 domain-containing protein n=1 Tax=Catenovulum adriaticum TaxID=2984846 RepID=A0ABY7AQY4_9ALTE|nr:DUF3293 domain-containing protein [Catenovulum sp. TS8]WAJ70661.1 DUF3293 domain-containing protein [Catenovulum sp. TS8]
MDQLWYLYTRTIFLMEQRLNAQASFAIITAYNPLGSICTKNTNQRLDNRLQADIELLKAPYRKLWGCSPEFDHFEHSWAVMTDKGTAINLAKKYQQNAIYWVERGYLFLVPCILTQFKVLNLGEFEKRCQYQLAKCGQ